MKAKEKPLTKEQKNHPFFCHKKGCRKSAWETPEYMSEEDWTFLEKVIKLVEEKDSLHFSYLYHDEPELLNNFFNHAIGWPEGWNYCHKIEFVENTAMPGMTRHNIPKLKEALKLHKK